MSNLEKICKQFRWFYKNGYITARDGNACLRAGKNFIVTASGVAKHKMVAGSDDFISVDKNGQPMSAGQKASIETPAHIVVLNDNLRAGASIHVHSPNTVALAELFDYPDSIRLVKSLNRDWPELFRYTRVGAIVPFMEPGSLELHEGILDAMRGNDICIMKRHGVMASGKDLDQCMEHIVRLEHIATILLKIVTASGSIESIL